MEAKPTPLELLCKEARPVYAGENYHPVKRKPSPRQKQTATRQKKSAAWAKNCHPERVRKNSETLDSI
jgi:hypothetical protein